MVIGTAGEQPDESGRCEQLIVGSRNDPRQQCGADGTLRYNGRVMCDAHWQVESVRLSDVRALNTEAAEYCLIHGIEPTHARVNGGRLAATLRRPPGKAWAYRLKERQRAGEKLLPIQITLMSGALYSDLPDEDKSIYEG